MNPLASLLLLGDTLLSPPHIGVVRDDPAPSRTTPRPLVNRCACGRQISNNKASCALCAESHRHDLADAIHSEEDLLRVLDLVPKDQREEVFDGIRPLLESDAIRRAMELCTTEAEERAVFDKPIPLFPEWEPVDRAVSNGDKRLARQGTPSFALSPVSSENR